MTPNIVTYAPQAAPGQIPAGVDSQCGRGSLPDKDGAPVASILNRATCKGVLVSKSAVKQRIVGYKSLRNLLQPKHSYFRGKEGYIEDFLRYSHEDGSGVDLLYPKIKALHKENPYRKRQLNVRSSVKTYKTVQTFVDAKHLENFRIIDMVFPMQRELSHYLSRRPNKSGVQMAWGMWKRALGMMRERLPELEGAAWHLNLHTWSTKDPTKPHYHFHGITTNYNLVQEPVEMPDGEIIGISERFEERPLHVLASGTIHAFTPEQLLAIKTVWLKVQTDFARRHKIKGAFDKSVMEASRLAGYDGLYPMVQQKGVVNVYVEPQTLRLDGGEEYEADRAKFVQGLRYNGRHWSENYCEYSNEHLDAPDPPQWLRHYDNRARTFGWWSNINNWLTPEEILEIKKMRERISPYNAKKLVYQGKAYIRNVADGIREGDIGYVEFKRRTAIEGDLTFGDADWLESVQWPSAKNEQLDLIFEAAALTMERDQVAGVPNGA